MVGWGASAGSSSPVRIIPISRRISASASRPVASTDASASRARSGSRSIIRLAACAWMTMPLTLWASTSCISRAIRARSSATARSACRSFSRSSGLALSASAHASWLRAFTIRPTRNGPPTSAVTKTKVPATSLSSSAAIQANPSDAANPISASRREQSAPSA